MAADQMLVFDYIGYVKFTCCKLSRVVQKAVNAKPKINC